MVDGEIQGSPLSTLYGGVTTKLSYKGFSLDAQLSFGFGNKVYDSYAYLVQSDGLRTHLYPGYKSQLDYWTPENPNALNPKPIYRSGNKSAHQPSTRYLYKGDYMNGYVTFQIPPMKTYSLGVNINF